MDISTLKHKIEIALQSSPFDISGAGLESAGITTLLTNFFSNDQFQLSGASKKSESDTGIVVQGQMTQELKGLANLQATATFTVDDNNAQIHIIMTGLPQYWKLSDTFPSLKNSLFDYFDYGSPSLTLDSQAQQVLPSDFPESFGYLPYSSTMQSKMIQGLSLRTHLVMQSSLDGLNWFFNESQCEVCGAIVLSEDQPSICLKSAPQIPQNIAGYQIPFALNLVAVLLEPVEISSPLFNTTCIQLEADIEKDIDGSEPLNIPVYFRQYSNHLNVVFIKSNLSSASSILFNQIPKLIDNAGIDGQVPASFPALNNIQLESIDLSVAPVQQKLLSVAATISYKNDNGWPVFGGIIVFMGISVTFTYIPFGINSVSTDVTCKAEVSGGTLDASISLPDLTFSCELEEGQSIDIVQLVRTVVGDSISMPQINCTQLKLFGDIPNNQYRFQATVTSDWIFHQGSKPMVLTEINMDLTYLSGTQSSISGEIVGVFSIAGRQLFVAASYDSSEDGWEFSGGTGPGQEIPIGELIDEIANLFGNVTLPEPIKDLVIQNLYVSFNTKTKNFSFSGEAKFPIDDKEVDIIITIDIRHTAAGAGGTGTGTGAPGQQAVEISFSGTIIIGTMEFAINFEKDPTSTILAATYSHTPDQPKLKIKDLVSDISSEAAAFIPESLEIDLKDVLFVYSKTGTAPATPPPTPPTTPVSKFLLGMDIGAHIGLSDLPVAGSAIPGDMDVGIDDLQILIASRDFTRNEVTAVNGILPDGVARLPLSAQSTGTGSGSTTTGTTDVGLKQGLNFSAKMQLGTFSQPLMLPASGSSQPAVSPPAGTPPPTARVQPASSGAAWFPIKKDIGPLHFERVGFQYKDEAIWFLLDAALSLAGLTISLDGLGLGSPLNEFKPQFNLNGLGIDYKSGPVEIGGAFLKAHVIRDGMEYDEYSGSAVIKTAPFSIAAIGSYTLVNGEPSLFIYAFLDMPLGGPSFFFVNGLAAGFGYNRSLIMPAMNQIAAYPLVEEAINGTGSMAKNNLSNELQKLSQYIPPDTGQIFFCAGIKFNSFKLVDSFALLAISFGNHFEIDLLGLSTAVIPTPEAGQVITPLAVVQMALRAQFIPDQGFLGVEAQLTPASYILDRSCRLTGGFAFYCWFSGPHSGDFALTLGGYHPNFNVPAHYPVVPRLGINWQLTREIGIKGDAYFALCPHALMAGGHLEAVFQSGPIRAWFNAGADFLMSWKPFHYEASCHVNVGGSYTFECFGTQTISIDVGAELNIWGPDFSGDVTVDLCIVSFTISFGNSRPAIAPIDWSTFRESFLPAENDKICSISVKDGLVRTMGESEAERWIINPKNFSLTIDSAVPAKTAFKKDIELNNTGNSRFGIGSMAVQPAGLSSEFIITITREQESIEDEFQYIPILKKVPTAMWGTTLTTDLNGPQFIDNALCGFEIKPAAPPPPGDTRDIDRAELAYDTTLIPGSFQWEEAVLLNSKKLDDNIRSNKIKQSIVNNSNRTKIMADLGVAMEIVVNESIVDSFLYVPQIAA